MPEAQRTKTHLNDERTVHCPVGGCDETPLARGVHLHVMRSVGDGHGPQGEVPEHLDFENLETAGTRAVSMDYPEHRQTEQVARLCPFCDQPFRGKQGVQIHLGQVAGRNGHPEDARDRYDPDDYPIAHVDEHGNVVDTIPGETMLPTTRQRRDAEGDSRERFIELLRERGYLDDDDAEEARELLA